MIFSSSNHAALALVIFGSASCGADYRDESERSTGTRLLPLAVNSPEPDSPEQRARLREEQCSEDPRVLLGLVTAETCLGAELFFRETFSGNGRTCGSCHPANHNFTIDPEFIAALPDDDPLFVAEQDPELAELERPDLLRQLGLNLVNADGLEDPTHKFVMRSVSHLMSLSTSLVPPPSEPDAPRTIDDTTNPPMARTGWSGDGAPGNGELIDFADGAIRQHATRSLQRVAGVDFVLPTETERKAMAAFMMNIGRLNEIDLTRIVLTDPGADRGRTSFAAGVAQECDSCHHNAGANGVIFDGLRGVSFLANFSSDTGVESARPEELEHQRIPADGAFGLEPFDRDGDGELESFGNGRFNIPPLIEAADTGPFFHANAFQTLEEAITFYTSLEFSASQRGRDTTFVRRPGGGPFRLTGAEIQDLGRLLRVLNAALNAQQAIKRLDAVVQLMAGSDAQSREIQAGLIALADTDLVDALEVLSGQDALNVNSRVMFNSAREKLVEASEHQDLEMRRTAMAEALEATTTANAGLGAGLRYRIGESGLRF